MPELSIIVPVYKVEKYLPRCIDSILAQTFRDFELILIDDGSPDNCGQICDEYAARDSRIKVIHQENAGVSAARNAGLDIACGTYLGFVDSDDWIEPEMYETMIATAKEQNVDVVVCGIKYRTEDGTLIRSDLTTEGLYNNEQMLSALYGMPNLLGGGCCNKIILRKSAEKVRFLNRVAIGEDFLYLFDVMASCNSCKKIPYEFYSVNERAGSATRTGKLAAVFAEIMGSKLMIPPARRHSKELEGKAMDRHLDVCLRYIPKLRTVGRASKSFYGIYLLRVRLMMICALLCAYRRRLLPKSKIHGYIYGMITA